MNKKIAFLIIAFLGLCFCIGTFLFIKNTKTQNESPEKFVEINESSAAKTSTSKPTVKTQKITNDLIVKKLNYSNENNNLPLIAISEISSLPENIKLKIDEIAENNNIYYIKQKNDSILLIIGRNEGDISRQDIEFVKIDEFGNSSATHMYDIKNISEELKNEWIYDKKSKLPLIHKLYSKEGNLDYIETWNYSEDDEIKYQLKNADDKVISLKKEIQSGDENLRVEHLLYDENGNTKLNISANYDGPQITRFTYYNADEPDDCITVISEYTDGNKTKEQTYSIDYKLKNTYDAEYNNGELVNIKIFDSSNNKIEELSK